MLAVLMNVVAVLVGGTAGLFLGKIIPERFGITVMKGLGLCTLFIGITGLFEGQNMLIPVISIVIGAIIGELCDLDGRLNRLAGRLEQRFQQPGQNQSIAGGFITASLLFCVGAMSINGSIQAGLTGNTDLLVTKSLMDLVSSFILSSTLGLGVVFSALFILVYQGAIVLLAQTLAPVLDVVTVGEMTCAGSIVILGLAFNLLDITKLKVINYLPALFIPIILCRFM